MTPEGAWRGGRLQSALRIGVASGILFGIIEFALSGSAARGASSGLLFGVMFGAASTLINRRRWPGSANLNNGQRMSVVRIVHRGAAVDDPRLAPAIVEYAGVVRRAHERDHRFRGVLWVFALLTLLLAAGATAAGDLRAAAVWWVLLGLWVLQLVFLQPRRRERSLARADQAEARARDAMSHAEPESGP